MMFAGSLFAGHLLIRIVVVVRHGTLLFTLGDKVPNDGKFRRVKFIGVRGSDDAAAAFEVLVNQCRGSLRGAKADGGVVFY